VRTDYVEKPDEGKLIESAINGMLAGLDLHSSYMDSKSLHEMQVEMRGEFGGVGPLGSDNGAAADHRALLHPVRALDSAKGISPDIEVLQEVPEELNPLTDTRGEASLALVQPHRAGRRLRGNCGQTRRYEAWREGTRAQEHGRYSSGAIANRGKIVALRKLQTLQALLQHWGRKAHLPVWRQVQRGFQNPRRMRCLR
jgi:hypothetical protein